MLETVALPFVAVSTVLAACALLAYRSRRRRTHWRVLRDLQPVSEHWLSDFRRGR
jgi:hypothetical protein